MNCPYLTKCVIKIIIFFIASYIILVCVRISPPEDFDPRGKWAPPPIAESRGWSNHEQNAKFNKRFWDLIYSANVSSARKRGWRTSPLFSDGGKVPYLWRPLRGQEDLSERESSRVVPQIVWQMEMKNSPLLVSKKIPVSFIYQR